MPGRKVLFLYQYFHSLQQPVKQDYNEPHFTNEKSEANRVRSPSPRWQMPSSLFPGSVLNGCATLP